MRDSTRVIRSAQAWALVLAVLVPANGVRCEDHLVTPSLLQQRLAAVAQERQRNAATVTRFLGSNETREVASASGIHSESLARQVPVLTDAELADLASRVRALESDPVAGMSRGGFILVILLVALVVFAASGGLCMAGCN